ncbi:MAG: cation acetate symporter [Armatimonadetes bacterium]|nr:cation acetate symporter [Armatimonadota bacterium]
MIELIFVILVTAATIGLGIWATKKSQSVADFFVAGRSVNVFWNASAISGEYLSAASFMGIAGLIMKFGYDALWYPVGYAAGYLFLLLFIAGPLRRFGAYTIPDFAEGRFHSPAFRKVAVLFVLFIGFFYTMPQMKAAGLTMQTIMGWPYYVGIIVVGGVITFNVALGGMKGITIVQAMQYWVKLFAIALPCFVVMSVVGFYNQPVSKALAEPKATPLVKGDAIKIKGKEAAPNNAIALSTAAPTMIAIEKDTVLASISVNPKPKEGATFDASEAIKPIGAVLDISTKSKSLAVPKDTLLQVTPFDVTDKDGKVTKASLKIEFEKPSEIRFSGTNAMEGGLADTPNAPTNAKWVNPFGPLTSKHGFPLLYTYSLIIALVCGTAGLPHILVRFYTNPDGRAAKRTTLWVMVLLGVFYIFTPMWGALGRAALPSLYVTGATDSAIIKLPNQIGNDLFGHILSGITSAGAFAAFMSTFSGLLVSMSSAFAHDIYGKMIRPDSNAHQRKNAFKFAAIGVGLVSMVLGLLVQSFDIAMMVGWAFAIAAASYFPLLLLGSWWRGLTAKGAATGMLIGGLASLAAIVMVMLLDKKVVSMDVSELTRSLLEQPAIWGVPLSLVLMVVVSKMSANQVPHDVDWMMLRLHAPEELGHSEDYIKH